MDLVCIDTEMTSIDPILTRLVGVPLPIKPSEACYILVAHRGPDAAGFGAVTQLSRDAVLTRVKL